MKPLSYSRYDWLLQLIVLPLYIGFLDWILIGDAYWHNWSTFGWATGITFAVSFCNWLVNNQIALYLNRKYSDPKRFLRRSLMRFVATGTSSSLHAMLVYGMFWATGLPGFQLDALRLGFGLLYTLAIVAIVVITYEGMDTFAYWQKSRQEVDMLSKAQLQAQLDALRQQVNPHFLFNSLNILDSLIDEDAPQARLFLEQLSTVYRYLLRSNDTPLVPLASELDFLDAYYHLLKTRHGDSLTLVADLPPGSGQRQLPPLTLQMLIENAVKHNVALPEQPLVIRLGTDANGRLVVSNNIQRRSVRALSNGVGLGNILTKYQMLGQPAPLIEDDGRQFRVTLPLV